MQKNKPMLANVQSIFRHAETKANEGPDFVDFLKQPMVETPSLGLPQPVQVFTNQSYYKTMH